MTNPVVAVPMAKAIARDVMLYSLRNTMKSLSIEIFLYRTAFVVEYEHLWLNFKKICKRRIVNGRRR